MDRQRGVPVPKPSEAEVATDDLYAFCALYFGYTPQETNETDYYRLLRMMQAVPRLMGAEEADDTTEGKMDRRLRDYAVRVDERRRRMGF